MPTVRATLPVSAVGMIRVELFDKVGHGESDQLFFDAGHLRFELLVDRAEAGFHAAAAAADRGIGRDLGAAEGRHRVDQGSHLGPQQLVIFGIQPQANAGAAGGQLQRLADQRQGDFRLPGEFLPDDPRGDRAGHAHRAGFPMREPRLLGLLQIGGRLLQRRDGRDQLPRHHLLRVAEARLPAFLGRLPTNRVGLVLRVGDDLARFGAHFLHVLAGLRQQIIEVEGHRRRVVGSVGGSDDRSHGWAIRSPD